MVPPSVSLHDRCLLKRASAVAGWAGMKVATQTNVKTMPARLEPILKLPLWAAPMGFSVVALYSRLVLFYVHGARLGGLLRRRQHRHDWW